jgi:cellulose biosynthesis protein BcsQ
MAINIAEAFAHRKKRVLLIDMDPQLHLTRFYGVIKPTDIDGPPAAQSYLSIVNTLDTVISYWEGKSPYKPSMTLNSLGVIKNNALGKTMWIDQFRFLPNDDNFSKYAWQWSNINLAPKGKVNPEVGYHLLKFFIELYSSNPKDNPDYIIIDAPPGINDWIVLNIINASDFVVLPVATGSFFDTEGMRVAIAMFENRKAVMRGDADYLVIPNNVKKRNRAHVANLGYLLQSKKLKPHLDPSLIVYERADIQNANTDGTSIFEAGKNEKLMGHFIRISKEIEKRMKSNKIITLKDKI